MTLRHTFLAVILICFSGCMVFAYIDAAGYAFADSVTWRTGKLLEFSFFITGLVATIAAVKLRR